MIGLPLRSRVQMADPKFKPQNELPPVIPNAGCWALHMSVSSNLRYQTLNGLDMVVATMMPGSAFKAYSTLIRLLNNIAGGMSFATIARVTGVQSSGGDKAKAAAAAAAPAKGGKGGKQEAAKPKRK